MSVIVRVYRAGNVALALGGIVGPAALMQDQRQVSREPVGHVVDLPLTLTVARAVIPYRRPRVVPTPAAENRSRDRIL